MGKIVTNFRFAACLILLASLSACQSKTSNIDQQSDASSSEFVYLPISDLEVNRKQMDQYGRQLEGRHFYFFIDKQHLSFNSEKTPIVMEWGDHALMLRTLSGDSYNITIDYDALPQPGVIEDSILGASFYGLRINNDQAIWCSTSSPGVRLPCGKWLAEAMASQIALMKKRKEFDAVFNETLKKYPDSASRPPLPEEARQFKVQAEAAIKAKRFEDAMIAYNNAVVIAPWWSAGFFNLAIIAADQKKYDTAIRNMKRYLLLNPAANDARKIQDQIYEWEGKIDSGN